MSEYDLVTALEQVFSAAVPLGIGALAGAYLTMRAHKNTRTTVVYDPAAPMQDPHASGVTYVAIDTSANPPAVYRTTDVRDPKILEFLHIPEGMLTIPIDQANKMCSFRKK